MSLFDYLCAMPHDLQLKLISCVVLLFSAKMAIKAYLADRRNACQDTN